MPAPKIDMRRKIVVVLAVALVCLVAVVIKLFILQLVQGEELQQMADETRTRTTTVTAARGTIYDHVGNKMALSITADSVGAYPTQVKESNKILETANKLAELLEMDVDRVYELLSSDSSFVWIKRKVDFEVAEMIEFSNLPGVAIVEENQRYYPLKTLASHVMGFAGIDNQGLEGVELSLDDILKGTDGSITGKFDAYGSAIQQEEADFIEPENGYDVYLTIDTTIQYYCERAIANLMESDTPPKRAGVIVMDPDTGAVVAMAVSDPYDPNEYDNYDSSSWRNWLISDSYEPGSTFKTITLSTALEEGTVNASSTFYDSGAAKVGSASISCWSSVPHGQQTLAEAVANSCNPAFVAIGQSIERKSSGLFYKYINSFGFGAETGIDLPGEAGGILQSEENVHEVEIATISIGQGIAVTPIQMTTALSAIANGGTLRTPQLVSKVMNGDKVIYDINSDQREGKQIISSAVAAQVREMMVGVVEHGSGANAAVVGYKVAGKTGTAQKAENGVYASGKYVGSFVGIVPADDPELVCLIVVDEPSGIYFGSQVAAPLFREIMTDALHYLGIPPLPDENNNKDENNDSDSDVFVPNAVNLDIEAAKTILTSSGLSAMIEGSGPLVTSQVPVSSTVVDSGSTVILYTGGISTNDKGVTYITVPNLYGKRFSEVANLLAELGLKLSADGSGVAVAQSKSAGSIVESGTTITVTFQDDSTGMTVLQGNP